MSFEIPSHCTALLAAKAGSDLTFAEIAKAIGKPEVWTTAVFFGQARTDEATAKKLVETLKTRTPAPRLRLGCMIETTVSRGA